jgi:hypothetical protein
MVAGPGDLVLVPISLGSSSGVVGYALTLEHSAFLQLDRADAGPIAQTWGAPTVNAQPTQVTLAAAGASPLAAPGTLAILRFRVREDAPNGHVSPLHFAQAYLNDGEIPVTTQDGAVSVVRIVVLSLFAARPPGPGQEFILTIRANDATSLLGYTLRINFLTDDFDVLEIIPGVKPQSASWGSPTVNLAPGRITLAAAGALPLSGPATLVSLNLRAHSDLTIGDEFPFEFHTALLNDGDIEAVTEDLMLEIIDPNALPLGQGPAIALSLLLLFTAFRQFPRARRTPDALTPSAAKEP